MTVATKYEHHCIVETLPPHLALVEGPNVWGAAISDKTRRVDVLGDRRMLAVMKLPHHPKTQHHLGKTRQLLRFKGRDELGDIWCVVCRTRPLHLDLCSLVVRLELLRMYVRIRA